MDEQGRPELPLIDDLLSIIGEESKAGGEHHSASRAAEEARKGIIRRYDAIGVTSEICDHPIQTNLGRGYGTDCGYCGKRLD